MINYSNTVGLSSFDKNKIISENSAKLTNLNENKMINSNDKSISSEKVIPVHRYYGNRETRYLNVNYVNKKVQNKLEETQSAPKSESSKSAKEFKIKSIVYYNSKFETDKIKVSKTTNIDNNDESKVLKFSKSTEKVNLENTRERLKVESSFVDSLEKVKTCVNFDKLEVNGKTKTFENRKEKLYVENKSNKDVNSFENDTVSENKNIDKSVRQNEKVISKNLKFIHVKSHNTLDFDEKQENCNFEGQVNKVKDENFDNKDNDLCTEKNSVMKNAKMLKRVKFKNRSTF